MMSLYQGSFKPVLLKCPTKTCKLQLDPTTTPERTLQGVQALLVKFSLTYTCSFLFKSPSHQNVCVNEPIHTVFKTSLSFAIKPIAWLPQWLNASLPAFLVQLMNHSLKPLAFSLCLDELLHLGIHALFVCFQISLVEVNQAIK